jgi:hypothetical protein
MDEDIEYFLGKFGPSIGHSAVPRGSIEKFRGKLPRQLLEYWGTLGWCGFANGLFWIVDPEVWDEAMESLLEGTGLLEQDSYHVIARNAFGDLWLWGEKSGPSISIRSAYGLVQPSFDLEGLREDGGDLRVRYFFSGKARRSVDLLDDKQKPLFERALKKLGPLQSHELYGFVPLVGAGGACQLKSLQKLDAQVHMAILADMTEMRVMPDYAAEARKQGLI